MEYLNILHNKLSMAEIGVYVMETIIAYITDNEQENELIYKKATEVLRGGGLVAFPTETVYGLGADALTEEAALKIYAAKGRPSDNPLIVHIAEESALYELAAEVDERALKLARKFWPGPLTMILKKKAHVPNSITGGLDTVAIRMPSHPVARKLISVSGVYVAAPSANTSGKPSPTRAKHVIHDMQGRIDMIIADDTIDIGVESTIVDISGDVPMILRPGYITKAQLEEVLGEVKVDPAIMGSLADGVVPKAPGMKYRHYAPEAQMVLVECNGEDAQNRVVQCVNELTVKSQSVGKCVGVMATKETAGQYVADVVLSVGSRDDEASVAKDLYAALRQFDEEGVDVIYAESVSTKDVGLAVMNRLIKAAGHTIINVDEA